MDTGVVLIDEVAGWLRRDRRGAWVRVLVGPEVEEERPLRFAEILVGSEPPGWEHRTWTYSGWTFMTREMTARQLASLLESEGAGGLVELSLGELSTGFSLTGSPQWFRLASWQEYDRVELEWPSRLVNLPIDGGLTNQPPGYMVGMDGPSFPTFAGAFGAFFYDQWGQSGANQPTLGQIKVRILDRRARIRRTVARAASVDVWVDGRSAKGCHLELNSTTAHLDVELAGRGKVTQPLPAGLGQDPWLWLKSGSEWIDYRSLTPWGGRQPRGVEFEAPDDALAEVTALAAQGESTYLEYKSVLPDDNQTSKRKTLKTVVAFANGEGGTILFGVDGDDSAGTIMGLSGNPAQLVRRLNDLVRDCLSPAPNFTVAAHVVEGKAVIRLDVGSGAGVLYSLMLDTNRPEYYVRRNGSTYYARPEELAQVVVTGVQQTPGDQFRLG
jgi:hypothetical protein